METIRRLRKDAGGRVVTPLLEIVERHLAVTGTLPTRFGRDAGNDPRLVFDMRRGRRPRAPMRARILRLIDGGQECER